MDYINHAPGTNQFTTFSLGGSSLSIGHMAAQGKISKLTAHAFEQKYGSLVRGEYCHLRTAFLLRKALAGRTPAIHVSIAVLKVWFSKTRMPEGAHHVVSPTELQERYGALGLRLSLDNPSPYLLSKAFQAEDPPLYVSENTCKAWFRMYASELSAHHYEEFLQSPSLASGHRVLVFGRLCERLSQR